MSDNYVLDILLAENNNYMGTGFSKKQWDTLQDLLNRHHYPHRSPAPSSAPLAAPPQFSPPAQLAQPAPPQRPPAPKTDLQATLAELSKGIRRLNNQFDRLGYPPARPPADPPAAPLTASPPAHKLYTQASPELPPQPTSSPVPARSYPSPSVEDEEEVEEKQVYKMPLRNVKKQVYKIPLRNVK